VSSELMGVRSSLDGKSNVVSSAGAEGILSSVTSAGERTGSIVRAITNRDELWIAIVKIIVAKAIAI
jgi:hypothetical protein